MIFSVQSKCTFWNEYVSSVSLDPYSTRIKSLYKAYGKYKNICEFWYQLNNNVNGCTDGAITSAISKYGKEAVVYLTETSDLKEISRFLVMSGVISVLCDNRYNLDINGKRQTGCVMEYKAENRTYRSSVNGFIITDSPDLKDLYGVLLQNKSDTFLVPDFEGFYIDASHKLRHDTAKARGVLSANKLVSCAMAVAADDTSAVIGAVATLPIYHGKGMGTAVVNCLVDDLYKENRKVFLHRSCNENKTFYENAGFRDVSSWQEIYIK